jgi:hypothetical protein
MTQPKEHATLWQHVYGHKSPLAKRWLIWATAVQVVLLLSGALLTVGRAYGSWTNRDVAAALSLILLLIAAWRMRVGDTGVPRKAPALVCGTSTENPGAKHRLDDNVISGVLAVKATTSAGRLTRRESPRLRRPIISTAFFAS